MIWCEDIFENILRLGSYLIIYFQLPSWRLLPTWFILLTIASTNEIEDGKWGFRRKEIVGLRWLRNCKTDRARAE